MKISKNIVRKEKFTMKLGITAGLEFEIKISVLGRWRISLRKENHLVESIWLIGASWMLQVVNVTNFLINDLSWSENSFMF